MNLILIMNQSAVVTLIFYLIVYNLLPILIIYFIYYIRHGKNNGNFWKKRKVNGPSPNLIFGNLKENILGNIHISELTKKFYDKFSDEKMVGIYAFLNKPALILRDRDLIKDVLVKDFSSFSDRGVKVYDKVEPLAQHFFNLPEAKWRPIRQNLSPAFTALKIKTKFHQIHQVAEKYIKFIKLASESDCVEITEVIGKYMVEVIAMYGFSMNMDAFAEESKVFNRSKSSVFNFTRRFLREYLPFFYKHSHFFIKNYKTNNFYVNLVKKLFEYRKNNNIVLNDYFGILMDLKMNPEKINNIDFNDNMISAQAYVFFTAGADTTAIIISNALYELALNNAIQKKLRNEIKLLLDNQNLTTDTLKKMSFLDKIFKETLRKYPLRNIIRTSNTDYKFSNNVEIPKGTRIIIPSYGIHLDSHIYENPNKFDPERHNNLKKNTGIPFGMGPRACIGATFSEYTFKTITVEIIKNFNVRLCKNCEKKSNDPRGVFLYPKGGIHLRFEEINSTNPYIAKFSDEIFFNDLDA